MSVTPADAARLLAVAAVYDKRTVGEIEASAWADALNDLNPRACGEAIREHFAQCDDGRYLLPAHVRRHINEGLRRRAVVSRDTRAGCDCQGAIHPGHFECADLCAGGHIKINGEWMRCNHNGTYTPYDQPRDKRTTEAAHRARQDFEIRFDARSAAAGEGQES